MTHLFFVNQHKAVTEKETWVPVSVGFKIPPKNQVLVISELLMHLFDHQATGGDLEGAHVPPG